MVIHVVKPGDTLYSLALEYSVPMSLIVLDNGLEAPEQLVPGQALVIRFPQVTHTVLPGETLSAIAGQYQVSLRQLYQNNPALGGRDQIWPGETLVISYREEPRGAITVNAYAYPTISGDLLQSALPYLTYLTPFTYGFTPQGTLVVPEDKALIAAAQAMEVAPLMHLSTLTQEGNFSNELAHLVLNDNALQAQLIDQVVEELGKKGYRGLDVDFEYVLPEDASPYAAFLSALTRRLEPLGYPVIAALAPKTSSQQRGTLYEGHDYAAMGKAVRRVLLMTYEWGYTYGPPMAVAPLPNVRQVVEYALTQIPAEKIWLGVPNYGYDWPLPFVQGKTRATSISSQQAVALARRYGVDIQYDDRAQAPWFRYSDEQGVTHEVWFEDARSIQAKLSLVPEYGLDGVGYWNLMREFPQNWQVLSSLYQIRQMAG
jgi:spore germination protein